MLNSGALIDTKGTGEEDSLLRHNTKLLEIYKVVIQHDIFLIQIKTKIMLYTTTTGLKPAIPRSEVWCLIH